MVNFVIAGLADCPNYARSSYIAKYLENYLPNFVVVYLPFNRDAWREWLRAKNIDYKWYHMESPLIYKELLCHGGVPYLIGGVSEFWEYCYHYYDLECILSQDDINNLTVHNLENFEKNNSIKDSESNGRHILFYGIRDETLLYMMLPRLFEIEGLSLNSRLYFIFYDDNIDETSEKIFKDLREFLKNEYNTDSKLVTDLGKGLMVTDLLIILDTTYMISMEGKHNVSTTIKMNQLSEEINNCAKHSLKIIFANDGLPCFAATILYKNINFKINVVVVTSHHGLGALELISKKFDLDKRDLCALPVWGFKPGVEINDINSTIIKNNVYKPYERAIKSSDRSNLLLGTVHTEFRFINYLTDEGTNPRNKSIDDYKDMYREKTGNLSSRYAKLTSLLSLLKIWFAKNESAVISLGIPGNGSFGIQKGLVFSQPAILINNFWKPYANYPVNQEIRKEIHNLVSCANELLDSYRQTGPLVEYRSSQTLETGH